MKNKKTIYLHIGTPKTGTTTLQRYLVNNRDYLYKKGFLIPKVSSFKNGNHQYVANYSSGSNNQWKRTHMRISCGTETEKELNDFRDKFYISLRNEIKSFKGHSVLLSSEHLYIKLKDEAEIIRLKKLFSGICEDIKVVVYLREQSELLVSNYTTSIRNSKKTRISSIQEFSNNDLYDYNYRLKKWEDVFGLDNIILKIYDKKKFYKGDIINDFCHTLNIPRRDHQPILLNTAMSAKKCEFFRIIKNNIKNLSGEKYIPIKKLILKFLDGTVIDSPSVSCLINKKYQSVYDESNRELAKRYLGKDTKIFNKLSLNETALDQTLLLSDGDKKNIANQIIKNNRQYVGICKTIAAIFDVEYKGEKIPISCLESTTPKDYLRARENIILNLVIIKKKFFKLSKK